MDTNHWLLLLVTLVVGAALIAAWAGKNPQPVQDRGAMLISGSLIAIAGCIFANVNRGDAPQIGLLVALIGFCVWIINLFRR